MTLTIPPTARATMLIRKPVEEVFNAFIDPDVTTKFWFSRSTGRLAVGKTVTWYWDFYGVSGDVLVKALEKNKRIAYEWPTPVEMTFRSKNDIWTFVSVSASGFSGTDDEKVLQALDSTEGFNLVLSACKVFLEHSVDPRIIQDKHPDGWVRAVSCGALQAGSERSEMIRGMHAMFYSSEAEALRTFLKDKLALPGTDVGSGWLIFDAPEADLGIHPTENNNPPSGTADISFYCDKIQETVEELKRRGVEFTQAIEDHGYGLVTYFKVPGGFKVQLYEPRYKK